MVRVPGARCENPHGNLGGGGKKYNPSSMENFRQLTDADGWAVCGGSVRDQRWGSMGWNLSQGCLLCSCRIQGCRFGCKWYCDWCQHNVQRSNGLGIIYQKVEILQQYFCVNSGMFNLKYLSWGKIQQNGKV